MVAIRRLGPGDAGTLELLARDEVDFGLDDERGPKRPLDDAAAAAYLVDPAVLHWIATDDGAVVGHLLCHVLRMRGGEAIELLLYDIGVRAAHRRRGAGRALVDAMFAWMRANGARTVWVLADDRAVAFYRACGFAAPADTPAFLLRELGA